MKLVSLCKLDRLDLVEMAIVRAVVASARGRFLKRSSQLVTKLSNGWIFLAVACPFAFWHEVRRPVVVALLSMILTFVPYLLIKPAMARIRPCEREPALDSGIRPLDRFSCPSGHCMAATAFGIPLAHSFPSASVAVGVSIVLISWARIAVGHHYPSDLLFGLLIGIGIAVPISAMLL